jgi:hypothetical protein
MNLRKSIFLFTILLSHSLTQSQVIPLIHAHAHNDYKHTHPLNDALRSGFTSIEADVFLKRNKFVVAHFFPYFKNKKTLENLYLNPLLDSITVHNGNVYSGYETNLILLVDIKTDAISTYSALKPLIEKYASILSSIENGKLITRPVTIVLSGNKPFDLIATETNRYAFIDENLMTMQKNNFSVSYSPLASTKYSNILKWKGKGKITEIEKNKLRSLAESAHSQGKKVRLWASPENKNVWNELLDDGVDLISTDNLEELNEFLLKRRETK